MVLRVKDNSFSFIMLDKSILIWEGFQGIETQNDLVNCGSFIGLERWNSYGWPF